MAPGWETVEQNLQSPVLRHDRFNTCRIDVHAADIDHVVGAGQDAPLQPGPRAAACAGVGTPYNDIAGAVSNSGLAARSRYE